MPGLLEKAGLSKKAKDAIAYYGYDGPLESGMLHLIEEEGFKANDYKDDVGVSTTGVGMTGENKGLNFFTEVYPKYVAEAARRVKGFRDMPEDLQNAVLSGVYRGDLGPDTAELLSNGDYAAAAVEYLDHDEYRERKAADPEDGVVKRMERNRDVIEKYAAAYQPNRVMG